MGGRAGIYLCSCGNNISDNIDFDNLTSYLSSLEDVAYVKTYNLFCSEEGKNFLYNDILAEKPERIVIAACSPKEHEKTFRDIIKKAGINPYLFQMVNIREQVSWATEDKTDATEKAKAYIRAAIKRVKLHEPLEVHKINCNTDVLVIGAGPAGIETALLMARANRKVYLVEKSPCIGGKVARYEDVFPKMECASCMLEPKMDEILHNDNIELFVNSEVLDIIGYLGNFTVKIKKNATYVDKEKCMGCGACYEVCPVNVKNEYDYNLSERKAIYVPYTGALPNVPVIDKEHCIRMHPANDICKEAFEMGLITKEEYDLYRSETCDLCRKACMFEAINYEDKDEIIEKSAGGIVIATGFELFDPSQIKELGYGKIPEIYTSLEFERVLSQTGPTSGKLLMKNGKEPESVAIIHCIGSRNKKYQEYCSGICCLYALKFTKLIKKHSPSTFVCHIYTDWCVPGKDNQEFLNLVISECNPEIIRTSLPLNILISQKGSKICLKYNDLTGDNKEINIDMVVLCPAIKSSEKNKMLSLMTGVSIDKDGFFAESHTKLAPVSSNIEGICIAGCAQGPKDIQGSIAQGAASAGQLLSILVPGRELELEPIIAVIDENSCSGCMTCVGLCPYKAITFDKIKKVSCVNPALCKGCGTCVAACPSGSAKSMHFTTPQIFAEIEEVLK